MKRAIDDKSALVFSVGFYQAIARGQSVKDAFDLGCSLLSMCGLYGADVPELFGRADPGTVRLVKSGASNVPANPLQISDVQVIPNDSGCTLDFRVWNDGNRTILINRVLLRAVEVHYAYSRPRLLGYFGFSKEYDVDIDLLREPGDTISCNVSQVVSPQDVDRFGIRIDATFHEGESRLWKLRPSLLTNLGRVEGPDVAVLLPPTLDESPQQLLEELAARALHWQNAIPDCLTQYRHEIQNPKVSLAPIWEILERAYTNPNRRFQVLSDWLGPPIGPWNLGDSLPGRLVRGFPKELLIDLGSRQ